MKALDILGNSSCIDAFKHLSQQLAVAVYIMPLSLPLQLLPEPHFDDCMHMLSDLVAIRGVGGAVVPCSQDQILGWMG